MEQVQKLQKQNNKLRTELDDKLVDSDKLRVSFDLVVKFGLKSWSLTTIDSK